MNKPPKSSPKEQIPSEVTQKMCIIKSHLNQHNYQSLMTLLSQPQFSSSTPSLSTTLTKKLTIKYLSLHLETIYHLGQTPHQHQPQEKPTYDLDIILQICTKLIIGNNVLEQSDCQLIQMVIRQAVQEDVRYAFVMYRGKCANFGQQSEGEQGDLYGLVSRVKYLGALGLFLEGLIGNKGMFDDYLQLLEDARNKFQHYCSLDNTAIKPQQPTQSDDTTDQSLYIAYLHLCTQLVESCHSLFPTSKKDHHKLLHCVLQKSIPPFICLMKYKWQQAIIRQVDLVWWLGQLLVQQEERFRVEVVTELPTVLLVVMASGKGVVAQTLQGIVHGRVRMYVLWRLLMEYGPGDTLGRRVGGSGDQMDSFLQECVIKGVCRMLLGEEDGAGLEIQGEKIWINKEITIDLVQIYRRLAIYSGFISQQHSPQCHLLIKKVLQLSHPRYKHCPMLPLQIWSSILLSSSPKQLAFRILCLTSYRKLLISHRVALNTGTFESHPYHCHGIIFIHAGGLLQKLVKYCNGEEEGTVLEYNFIGHVISFVANWLVCVRIYMEKYGRYGYQCGVIGGSRQKIGGLIGELKDKIIIDKALEGGQKQDQKNMDREVVLMRFNQLNFDS